MLTVGAISVSLLMEAYMNMLTLNLVICLLEVKIEKLLESMTNIFFHFFLLFLVFSSIMVC